MIQPRLVDFIKAAGAVPYPVLPYVYVSEADDARVLAIISDMAAGQFDESPLRVPLRFAGFAM